MKDLKVGDIIFMDDKAGIQEKQITRVGRKYYYYVQYGREEAVLKETLHTGSPYGRIQFYTTREEIVNLQRINKIRQRVLRFFNWQCKIATEDLEKVYDIIKTYPEA